MENGIQDLMGGIKINVYNRLIMCVFISEDLLSVLALRASFNNVCVWL